MIEAILIDSREPDWVKRLTFGGVPAMVCELPAGDVQAVTKDGATLLIERKTPDDLLGSLREERLFPQMARLSEARISQMLDGIRPTHWPYLVVNGNLTVGQEGKAVADGRLTGWQYTSVMGALLNIQEMGIFVHWCAATGFEEAVITLGNRDRDHVQKIAPPRPAVYLGPGSAFLAGLPGIGPERVIELMKWADGIPAHALAGIVDLSIECPLPINVRKRIRQVLGLKDQQAFDIWIDNQDHEVMKVLERIEDNV